MCVCVCVCVCVCWVCWDGQERQEVRKGLRLRLRSSEFLAFINIFTLLFQKVADYSSFIRCHCTLLGDISQP